MGSAKGLLGCLALWIARVCKGGRMTRTAVPSRSIRTVRYDPATRVLEIQFHQGRVYEYAGVPYEEWVALMGAPSLGRHLRERIAPRFAAKEVAG